jgi:hypothetical protein
VDTVVERHSAEQRARPDVERPDNGRPDIERPDNGRPDSGMSEGESPRDVETLDYGERGSDVSVWDESMAGDVDRDSEVSS